MVDAQRPKVIFPLRVKELQIQNNKDLFPVGKYTVLVKTMKIMQKKWEAILM